MKYDLMKPILAVLLTFTIFISSSCEQGSKAEKQNIPLEVETMKDSLLEKQPLKVVDQQAVEILRRSLTFLSSLSKFSVDAHSTLEDINKAGHRVDYEIASSLIVNRPNKLKTERHGDLYNQVFYYNGSTLTLYNPVQGVYATEAAPGTIEEMFHFARDEYGLSAPVSDLIYFNSFELLTDEVDYAEVIGKEMIGKVRCDHLLLSKPGVDFQIWIADKGDPLPYKYVVTDTSTPELLAYSTTMHNWHKSPILSKKIFEFKPPKGVNRIDFLEAE